MAYDSSVPTGSVAITSEKFRDEYLYATQYVDSSGQRSVHTWTRANLDGTTAESDPQSNWRIKVLPNGLFSITNQGGEYLRQEGGVVHTWGKGDPESDMDGQWVIKSLPRHPGCFVICHPTNQFLYAEHRDDGEGRRSVITFKSDDSGETTEEDHQSHWVIRAYGMAGGVDSNIGVVTHVQTQDEASEFLVELQTRLTDLGQRERYRAFLKAVTGETVDTASALEILADHPDLAAIFKRSFRAVETEGSGATYTPTGSYRDVSLATPPHSSYGESGGVYATGYVQGGYVQGGQNIQVVGRQVSPQGQNIQVVGRQVSPQVQGVTRYGEEIVENVGYAGYHAAPARAPVQRYDAAAATYGPAREATIVREVKEVRTRGEVQEDIREVQGVTRYVDKIVEVPDIQTRERIVEVPQIQYVTKTVEKVVENIVHVPKIEYEEVILTREVVQEIVVPKYVEVPQVHERIVHQSKEFIVEEIVEVPKVVTEEVIVERTVQQRKVVPKYVEVPQIHERIVHKQVEQIEEVIVEVPKIEYQEVIVEREVPQRQVVPKYVEVPQVHERIVHKEVEKIEEVIVEVPKIEYEEVIVERTVPQRQIVPKYVEVPQVHKRVVHQQVEKIEEVIVEVPKIVYEEEIIERTVEQVVTVPKYVEVPQIQERIVHVPKVQIKEVIVEVPKIEYQEKIIERPVEEVVTVPRYVEVPRIVQRIQERIVEQPRRTVEVVKEQLIEKIVERKRPVIQEVIRHVPKIEVVEVIQEVVRPVRREVFVPHVGHEKVIQVREGYGMQFWSIGCGYTGNVAIVNANWRDEYLYTAGDDDGDGRRSIFTCRGENRDAQGHWRIVALQNGLYGIISAKYADEYLYAKSGDDGDGRRFIHTWMKGGSVENDPQGQWRITALANGHFSITNAKYNSEYLYASTFDEGGRRKVFTWMESGNAIDDTMGQWIIRVVDFSGGAQFQGGAMYAGSGVYRQGAVEYGTTTTVGGGTVYREGQQVMERVGTPTYYREGQQGQQVGTPTYYREGQQGQQVTSVRSSP